MYSQKWNSYFQHRIIMFCLPVPTLIYLWEIYIFPGSVCLFCWRELCVPILGIAHRHMNVEIGTEAVQFPEKEYRNGIFLAVYPTNIPLYTMSCSPSHVFPAAHVHEALPYYPFLLTYPFHLFPVIEVLAAPSHIPFIDVPCSLYQCPACSYIASHSPRYKCPPHKSLSNSKVPAQQPPPTFSLFCVHLVYPADISYSSIHIPSNTSLYTYLLLLQCFARKKLRNECAGTSRHISHGDLPGGQK